MKKPTLPENRHPYDLSRGNKGLPYLHEKLRESDKARRLPAAWPAGRNKWA